MANILTTIATNGTKSNSEFTSPVLCPESDNELFCLLHYSEAMIDSMLFKQHLAMSQEALQRHGQQVSSENQIFLL